MRSQTRALHGCSPRAQSKRAPIGTAPMQLKNSHPLHLARALKRVRGLAVVHALKVSARHLAPHPCMLGNSEPPHLARALERVRSLAVVHALKVCARHLAPHPCGSGLLGLQAAHAVMVTGGWSEQAYTHVVAIRGGLYMHSDGDKGGE